MTVGGAKIPCVEEGGAWRYWRLVGASDRGRLGCVGRNVLCCCNIMARLEYASAIAGVWGVRNCSKVALEALGRTGGVRMHVRRRPSPSRNTRAVDVLEATVVMITAVETCVHGLACALEGVAWSFAVPAGP